MPYGTLRNIKEDNLLKFALQQEKVQNLIHNKSFEVREVSTKAERGAVVHLKVPELKLSEDDILPSFSKKARQEKAKLKKKKETIV